jgi:hypothetical protein
MNVSIDHTGHDPLPGHIDHLIGEVPIDLRFNPHDLPVIDGDISYFVPVVSWI